MSNKFEYYKKNLNFERFLHFKFSIIIYLIYIVNVQKIYSHELRNIKIFTHENITDYKGTNQYLYKYDENQIINKNEVLKIRNEINLSYYCKNNNCIKVDRHYLPKFIEFPDKEGNIKRYISKSYNYNDLESDDYFYSIHELSKDYGCNNTQNNEICYTDVYISFRCTSDSHCLTNKCIHNICVFNEENPIDFCTDIYSFSLIFGRRSYMYCGKTIGELCKIDNECGSKSCLEDGSCGNAGEPSEMDGLFEIIILIYSSIFLLISLCCGCCTYLIIKHKKK